MAIASWAASTAYALGDVRRAATAQVTGLLFKFVTANCKLIKPTTFSLLAINLVQVFTVS